MKPGAGSYGGRHASYPGTAHRLLPAAHQYAARLGHQTVFGFAQSVEQSASPLTAFLISPVAQFMFIPFMTDGYGARTIGGWFGTGTDRRIALVFILTGVIGLVATTAALRSRPYRLLSRRYAGAPVTLDQ